MIQPHRLIDSHGRVLRDLRISITDRCNFRCLYCLPETEAAQNFYRGRWAAAQSSTRITRQWQPAAKILTFEEIERVTRLAVDLGIRKIRLTGGEPLLRQQIEVLIAKISRIKGVEDLALTTNGFLFARKAKELRKAGLHRVSFSLDSLDRANFKKMTGRDGLEEVFQSIRAAQEEGFSPIKVNAVVIRGINDHEIENLVRFGSEHGLILRFIEFMPLDSGQVWQKDLVVRGWEIRERLQQAFSLQPLEASHPAETAKRWTLAGTESEIGIIAPVSEPFCGQCNRLRLTADGKLRTCLFSLVEHDLRMRLRDGDSDADLSQFIQDVVWQKEDRHHIGEEGFQQPERTMSCIGG